MYSGAAPFSEPEIRAVRSVLDRYGNNIKMYTSIHTHGNMVLYPWGYNGYERLLVGSTIFINTVNFLLCHNSVLIDNWQLHDDIGHVFADAIFNATGTNYTVGNAAIVLNPEFGASDDYAASVGVQASFTFELTGGGEYGFDLPVEQLNEVITEAWIGFREVYAFAAAHDWNNE